MRLRATEASDETFLALVSNGVDFMLSDKLVTDPSFRPHKEAALLSSLNRYPESVRVHKALSRAE